EQELVDGALVLRVDGSWLAAAALPLVIDPLVSTFPVTTTPQDDFLPDVAYDAANDTWLVVYEEAYSASDRDVFAQLLASDGTPLGGGYVDFTSLAWDHARCANLAVAQQFLVVAAVANGAAKTIQGRTVQAGTLAMGPQVPI